MSRGKKNLNSINKTANSKELRKFGLTMAIMFSLVFGVILPLVFKKSFPLWPHYVGVAFFIPALVFPQALNHVHFAWMKFAEVLGYVNSRILLSVVYVLLIVPMGLLMRIIKKDPLQQKYNSKLSSYRMDRKEERKFDLEMRRPF